MNKNLFFLLFNYNGRNHTLEFLDSLALNTFLSYILQPARAISESKTLINNIFTNVTSLESISVNLTVTMSDQPPEFQIVCNVYSNLPSNKCNIYERYWYNFHEENLYLDNFSID